MSNTETARRVIELVNAYEFDELEKHIHEDIVMEAPYQAFHQGPLRRGKRRFMEGFRFVPNVFKTFKLNIHELYACPEQDTVILEMTSVGIFAGNNGTYQNRYVVIFQFKDGLIYLWREFFNPETMNDGMRFMLEV